MSPDEHLAGREARLFPSFRIRGDREAEVRATASLLATVMAVQEFGRSVVKMAAGPAGRITCFTEVPYKLGTGPGPKTDFRPDGLIRAVRGSTNWIALVEAKVGRNPPTPEQVSAYHQLAGQEGFDALITISNQPAHTDGRPPVALDGRRLRRVDVTHLSWERVLTEAQKLSRKKAVADPDQKWILDEWIRYVDDPTSRIIEAPDLGKHWAEIIKRARMDALTPQTDGLYDVCDQWAGVMWKAALSLTAKLGVDVRPRLARKHRNDHSAYVNDLVQRASEGCLESTLRVPDAAGDISIAAFLSSGVLQFSVDVDAPNEGRQITRLKWMLRQIRDMDSLAGGLELIVRWHGRSITSRCPATKAVTDVNVLLCDERGDVVDKSVMPRRFTLRWTSSLKRKGRSSIATVTSLFSDLERFYRSAVEGLVPYVPRAPRMPAAPPLEAMESEDRLEQPTEMAQPPRLGQSPPE